MKGRPEMTVETKPLTKTLTLSEIIKDESNWCKGKWRNGVSFCLEGAILYSLGAPTEENVVREKSLDTEFERRLAILNEVVLELFPGGHGCAFMFNDDESTTIEDIKKVCELYDARLEAEQCG